MNLDLNPNICREENQGLQPGDQIIKFQMSYTDVNL